MTHALQAKHHWTFEQIGKMTMAQMIASLRDKPPSQGVTVDIATGRKIIARKAERREQWITEQMRRYRGQ